MSDDQRPTWSGLFGIDPTFPEDWDDSTLSPLRRIRKGSRLRLPDGQIVTVTNDPKADEDGTVRLEVDSDSAHA